ERRGRALGFVLIGRREPGLVTGEAELEQVDAVTEADQALAEREGGDLGGRGDEGFDAGEEAVEAHGQTLVTTHLAFAITHRSSIEQMFVAVRAQEERVAARTTAARSTRSKPLR